MLGMMKWLDRNAFWRDTRRLCLVHLFADSVRQPDNESQAIPYGNDALFTKEI